MDTAERSTTDAAPATYDGFISYSHAADDLLAPRLQAGLQKFAKPWWRRRAVRIFRDESSLAANPHLWSSITEALDDSSWFVLLLSPDAASSEWVGKEIEHWVANKPADRILPVVTDGEFGWENDDVAGSAAPPALRGVLSEEPRWVDLRFARGDENLDLKNPAFSAAVADVASAIRGIPKDELQSEEVRQHRRTVRTAWAAGIALAVLATAAVVASIFAVGQRNDARDNAALAEANAVAEAEARLEADDNAALAERNAAAEAEARQQADQNAALAVARELAASAINVIDEDPELSILLTLAAIDATPAGQDQPQEVIDALWRAVQEDRLVGVLETGHDERVFVALSPDDSTLFVANGFGGDGFPTSLALQAYSTSDLELLWEYDRPVANLFDPESEGDFIFLYAHASPDSQRVALSLWGSPARFMVFDATDGTPIFEGLFPDDCQIPATGGWSPDGSRFVVIHPCEGAQILDGDTFSQLALIETGDAFISHASFDDSSRLFLFDPAAGVSIYDPPDYSRATVVDSVLGRGDVSPDGSTLVAFEVPADPCQLRLPIPTPSDCGTLASYDARSGERIDLLTPLPAVPARDGLDFGFSGSDRLFAVPTEGAETLVFDIAAGTQVFSLPSGPGVNAAVSSDGGSAYTGHGGGQVKIWDFSPNIGLDPVGDLGTYSAVSTNTGTPAQTIGAFVAVDPGTFESQVFFYDLATGALVGKPVVGQQPITALADDRFLITGSYVGADSPFSWFVYEPMTGDGARIAGCELNIQTGLCPDGTPPPLFFWTSSTDGTELLRQGDGQSTLVDPSDGSPVGQLTSAEEFEFVGAFSEEMISGSSEGQVLVADRATGEELARIAAGGDRFDGDVGSFAFYKFDSMAIVDTTTWDVREFPIDLGRVQGMAVDSGLRRLALGDENGLHVFDLDSGELLTSIPIPGLSDVHWIDADRVLVGTQTGGWATVSLSTEDLIASARAGVTRGFTADECETYRVDPCATFADITSR